MMNLKKKKRPACKESRNIYNLEEKSVKTNPNDTDDRISKLLQWNQQTVTLKQLV